jgi:hypothetical protein
MRAARKGSIAGELGKPGAPHRLLLQLRPVPRPAMLLVENQNLPHVRILAEFSLDLAENRVELHQGAPAASMRSAKLHAANGQAQRQGLRARELIFPHFPESNRRHLETPPSCRCVSELQGQYKSLEPCFGFRLNPNAAPIMRRLQRASLSRQALASGGCVRPAKSRKPKSATLLRAGYG